jgi:hypothetical protein
MGTKIKYPYNHENKLIIINKTDILLTVNITFLRLLDSLAHFFLNYKKNK